MKFKVGDKVKFLNDVGEGTVKSIVSETLVNVETEDGFDIPTLVVDLLKVKNVQELEEELSFDNHEEFEDRIEKEVETIFNEVAGDYVIGNDRPEIFIALLPEFKGSGFIEGYDVYLINNSNYQVIYTLSKTKIEKQEHVDAGILGANTKVNFMYLSHKELNNNLTLIVQLVFYMIQNYSLQKPVQSKVIIDPVQLSDKNEHFTNDFFDEKAIILNINNEQFKSEIQNISNKEIEKVIKEKDTPIVKPVKIEKPITEEVDLHIEEIVDNHSGLSNGEIIEIQMSRFKIALEGGKRSNLQKMIFIHGVGNGTLRFEIRKYIDSNHSKFSYQDASFKEYGYGATMVKIR